MMQDSSISTPRGIWIITDEIPPAEPDAEAYSPTAKGKPLRTVPGYDRPPAIAIDHKSYVRAETLQQNLGEFLAVVENVFDQAEQSQVEQSQAEQSPGKARMQLEELELSIEINGEGQVSLLGTGGKAGAKGAIKLKFKRTSGSGG